MDEQNLRWFQAQMQTDSDVRWLRMSPFKGFKSGDPVSVLDELAKDVLLSKSNVFHFRTNSLRDTTSVA